MHATRTEAPRFAGGEAYSLKASVTASIPGNLYYTLVVIGVDDDSTSIRLPN